jgi:predicted GIY-YIG superfamily endonuclease
VPENTQGDRVKHSHYSVYVIELTDDPDVEPGKTVYVGQTWHTPEKRFEQHKTGIHAGKHARGRCIKLRPELYAHLNPLTESKSLEMERLVGDQLRNKGFTVYGGQGERFRLSKVKTHKPNGAR